MEVHHHPDLHHKRKNIREYLLEFLMIFLAVSMGFLSENVREGHVERKREAEFIHSLANDVQSDISRLSAIIEARTWKEIRMDSLTDLLNHPIQPSYRNDIYYLASIVTRGIGTRFTPNDGTMQQLKNSGGLRLIRNLVVADSIIKYDVQVRDVVRTNETESNYLAEYIKACPKIFDALILDQMSDSTNHLHRPTNDPLLMPFNKESLNQLNLTLFSAKTINKALRRDCHALLQQATNLLHIINKEYQ
jgi:hypothetical protein